MVTLLLTFFVMLYSFSTINAQKWEALVQSLRGNIGVLEGGASLDRLPGVDDTSIPQIDLEQLEGYRKKKKMDKPEPGPVFEAVRGYTGIR
jgi:chemotaxis protein MotB